MVCHSPFHYGFASLLLGNIFGTYLYGALTVQLYRYYMSFPQDRKPFKAVIYIVYVTETIFTVLLLFDLCASTIYIYHHSVEVDGQGPGITSIGTHDPIFCKFPALRILGVCGGTGVSSLIHPTETKIPRVASLTQSMYAYRIRIITKMKCIPWVIILMIALQLVAIVLCVTVAIPSEWVIIIWPSISLAIDVTITSIMVWYLKKDEIYCKQLEKKIARLIYLILGTGLLTAAINLCILVLSFFNPYFGNTYGLLIVLSKLYANSMMVLVNSRIPSARAEINHRATLDMPTIRLSSYHVTSQEAADIEHGQSVTPGMRGLSAHEAEDTPNNDGLDSSDSLIRGQR